MSEAIFRQDYLNYQRTRLIACFLILSTLAFCSCTLNSKKKIPPKAVDGILDLSAWDFKNDGSVNLHGEYEFYWKRLFTPQNFVNSSPTRKPDFIKVPGLWNDFESAGEIIPGTGYATYRLIVLLNGKDRSLALKVLDMSTAFTLFVNWNNLYSAGVVGENSQSSKPQFNPRVIDFQTNENQLEIIIQVSNFHHWKGGAWEPIILGTEDQIRNIRERKVSYELFLFGSIFIMAIYHFGLFSLRRKDRSTLYFGIFCLLIALRILTTGERYFLTLFPNLNWEIFVKLEYLSYYLAVLAFVHFFYALFHHRFLKIICLSATVVSAMVSALVIVLPLKDFSQTLTPYHLFTLILFMYGIYILLINSWKREYDAIVFLAGFSILLLSAINDMLRHENLLHTGNFIPLGLFVFIFSQAFLLSLRFSKAFDTVDIQRRKLGITNQVIRKQIRKSKQAEKALKESHERFLTVLDSIDANVYVADMSTHEILFMNRHMKDSFGHDFTGQICWQVIRNDMKACSDCSNEKLLNIEGKPKGVHVWEYRNSVTGRWYLNYDRAIKWGDDRFVRLQIATDVTERKLAEKTLQKAKDELEKRVRERTADILRANEALSLEIEERKQAQAATRAAQRTAEIASQAKSEFLANMSHELRTPLNHIIGFTELVLDKNFGDLNDIQQEYLGDVHQSSQHLLSLINDILDLSKIESGKLEIKPSDIDIKTLIESSLVMIKEKAMKNSIDLSVEMDGVPHRLKADERAIKQIMYNLLSNAVKFSPAGGRISVKAQACNSNRQDSPELEPAPDLGVQISVCDHGIGIEPQELEHIFNPFEQVENSASRKFQGTGLGLSLSKRLVELHRGKIWAESRGVGKGSTFSFIIPAQKAG